MELQRKMRRRLGGLAYTFMEIDVAVIGTRLFVFIWSMRLLSIHSLFAGGGEMVLWRVLVKYQLWLVNDTLRGSDRDL